MKIKRELFEIMGAPLKGTNPLPVFRARKYTTLKTDESYPEELKENGCYIAKVLPYLMQDRYTRKKETLHLKSYVLENEYLSARFLPEFGGRLHSLYDKVNKRELLFANPVIQPGNVATRNAWLSGGIEWNLGNFGHCYTTCDNMFSVILEDGEGNEFLRIYEFERNKSIFWQVDFHLPDGSPHLFAHVKTVNPFDRATTTYWWTNIAVPIDGTRVLASNKNVMSFIGGVASYERLPYLNALSGIDATYPDRAPKSFDYFIQKNKDGESTWESAAYPDGVVFYERSTAPLYYKKLFVWGNHPAGLNWQHSLSNGEGTGYYAELQAGIAPSQLHDKLMPANTTYEWTQCFGGVRLNADKLFDENYDNAVDYFDSELNKRMTADEINAYDEKFKALANLCFTEDKILHFGSGFGALEVKRMAIDGDGTSPASMLFPESAIGKAEEPWLALLNDGKPARLAISNDDEQKIANGYFLLTTKPVIYACNISESDIGKPEDSLEFVQKVKEYAKTENSNVLVVCAKIEQELSELEDDEKQMFLEDLGLSESGLEKVIKLGYETLGEISYLTAGEKEVRAWTIVKGTKAPGAAGKIHTDFEKGFIRADVVSYDNLVSYGSYNAAKEAGKVRSEGKDYVVQDGDVILFKFNV